MEKIKLEIKALSHSVTHSHNYAVILGESNGKRKLPIVIGGFEAQAIAVVLEGMVPNRPLTHDLFKNALQSFNIEIIEVIINQLHEGVFHSVLVCEKGGERYNIDSRTSDAIAMAVRFECPIYTYASILEIAGVEMEEYKFSERERDDDNDEDSPKNVSIQEMTEDALNILLQKALARENYEKAAQIRDELSKRQKGDEMV